MPSAEWRLFIPDDEGTRSSSAHARSLMALLEDVEPIIRTDVYIKGDGDVGIKLRGGGSLEYKALQRRQALGGGVGPGTAEIFKKVKLGSGASLSSVTECLREGGREVTEELEALLNEPVEVKVAKIVRKKSFKTASHTACFEVTEMTVSCAEIPEDYPKKWLTFCAEGGMDDIEAFVTSGRGKPLVPLMAVKGACQAGYPQFVRMVLM